MPPHITRATFERFVSLQHTAEFNMLEVHLRFPQFFTREEAFHIISNYDDLCVSHGSPRRSKYCAVCLLPASFRCSRCKAVRYCSTRCQVSPLPFRPPVFILLRSVLLILPSSPSLLSCAPSCCLHPRLYLPSVWPDLPRSCSAPNTESPLDPARRILCFGCRHVLITEALKPGISFYKIKSNKLN